MHRASHDTIVLPKGLISDTWVVKIKTRAQSVASETPPVRLKLCDFGSMKGGGEALRHSRCLMPFRGTSPEQGCSSPRGHQSTVTAAFHSRPIHHNFAFLLHSNAAGIQGDSSSVADGDDRNLLRTRAAQRDDDRV